jgi:Winged helix-turn helix
MSSVPQNVIKHKVGLLNLATELGNVSRACKVMGFSRDTFYRYQSALEADGEICMPWSRPHRFNSQVNAHKILHRYRFIQRFFDCHLRVREPAAGNEIHLDRQLPLRFIEIDALDKPRRLDAKRGFNS